MNLLLGTAAHVVLLVLAPPLLLGVVNRTKARFAGRAGPPLLQPYYDLARLFRKGMVVGRTTTWMFRAGPCAAAAAVFVAGLFTPFGNAEPPLGFAGDMILVAYLLAMARFFSLMAAIDTGSAFAGMGAARDATFACLTEPAFFLSLLVLVRISGATTLGPMFAAPAAGGFSAGHAAPLVLVAAALFVVLLAENCRVPVDDPTTHLELTMIHEAAVLDHGGPLFGVALYAAAMKFFVYGALLLRVAAPIACGNAALDRVLFLLLMLALAVLVGVVESVMARLRMNKTSTLLVASCLLAGFAFALTAA